MPEVTEFSSEMGNNYIRERPLEEIIEKLMTPQEEEEEDKKDEKTDDAAAVDSPNATPAQEDPKASKLGSKKGSIAAIKESKESKASVLKNSSVAEVDVANDNN